MNYPKVFVIILNWNGLKDTLECLESVFKLDYPNVEVIVVDNGSTDDSAAVIRKNYPQVILIEGPSIRVTSSYVISK
jgi:GT2 family glycosyltransferase